MQPSSFQLARPKRDQRLTLLLAVAFIFASSSCETERRSGVRYESPRPVSTVVIVTFDGVRPEEIFAIAGPGLQSEALLRSEVAMPFFLDELGPSGVFLGHPETGEPMTVANPLAVSLPGYQSMFSGRPTLCFSNECGQPMGETLFGRVHEAFELPKESISVFASWEGLCAGLGLDDRFDAHCGADAIQANWRLQTGDTPREGKNEPAMAVDEAAFDLALQRLREPLPTLLYLALDATDATGHANDYAGHLSALAQYDEWLRALDQRLRQLEAEGHRSALLVTTDHGRGSGEGWSQHRWNVPGSERVWLFARGPGIAATGPVGTSEKTTLASVRPTVEEWLALEPVRGPLFGPPLTEILGRLQVGSESSSD